MTVPDFAELQAHLRATEPDLKKLASIKHLYQIDQMSPENVSAFASSIAEDTLHAANVMALGYLAAYHQWLADYFEQQPE